MHDKKETIKFILQILVSILTAIITALGTASCVRSLTEHHRNTATPGDSLNTPAQDTLNQPCAQLITAIRT